MSATPPRRDGYVCERGGVTRRPSSAEAHRRFGAAVTAAADLGRVVGVDSRPLRILLMTDKVPGLDNGYGMRVFNVLAGLRAAGEVTACLVDSSTLGVRWPDPDVESVVVRAENLRSWSRWARVAGRFPSNVRYEREPALRAEIANAVGGAPWDVVWCSRLRVHLLTQGLDLGPRILDLDDLNADLLRSEMRDRRRRYGLIRTLPRNLHDAIDAVRWHRLERNAAASVDRFVVCSHEDLAHVGHGRGSVVPNGYPRPLQPISPTPSATPGLLVVGSLGYEPNRLAVHWLVRDIMPRVRATVPDAELVVVGETGTNDTRRLNGPGVTFTGHVPDVAMYYADAAVAVVPLNSGAGTRMKVLEPLAYRVPLVSTSFGCRGHDLRPGTDALIADDTAGFAAACIDILRDPHLAARLATNGARRYATDFTSHATTSAVQSLVRDIVGDSDPQKNTRDRGQPITAHGADNVCEVSERQA